MIDFVVAGGQRCGSTGLADALSAGGGVFLPRREVELFERGVYERSDVSDLDALFRSAGPNLARGIKRPEYLHDLDAAANLHAHSPSARIVITLRNRIDRTLSATDWYLRDGLVPLLGRNDILRGLLSHNLVDRSYPHATEVLDFSLYTGGIERFQAVFGVENVFVTAVELLDPSELARIREFLQLPMASPESVAAAKIRRNAGSSGAFRKLHRWTAPLGVTLKGSHRFDSRPFWRQRPVGYALRGLVSRAERQLGTVKEPERLASDVECGLQEYFSEDMRRFDQLYFTCGVSPRVVAQAIQGERVARKDA